MLSFYLVDFVFIKVGLEQITKKICGQMYITYSVAIKQGKAKSVDDKVSTWKHPLVKK